MKIQKKLNKLEATLLGTFKTKTKISVIYIKNNPKCVGNFENDKISKENVETSTYLFLTRQYIHQNIDIIYIINIYNILYKKNK